MYAAALGALREAGVECLVGGAWALERYTGLARDTKDLDVFVRPGDCARALEVLESAGYRTEVAFPHWLAKARAGDDLIDVIFSSGNGFAQVDDAWFAHAVEARLCGLPVRLCPPEETIWSKAFVMERERYDGADVLHLLRATAPGLDWPRLLGRFGSLWHVLLAHLVLFVFVYPSERWRIPAWVTRELLGRLERELAAPAPTTPLCRGTLLSRAQYLVDVTAWGYRDARLTAPATMDAADIARWTAAIGEGVPPRPTGREPSHGTADADRRDR